MTCRCSTTLRAALLSGTEGLVRSERLPATTNSAQLFVHAQAALQAAQEAFRSGPWSSSTGNYRAGFLRAIAGRVKRFNSVVIKPCNFQLPA